MKITTSKEKFVKEIQTIQSGMNVKNGTLPILQNFLIETESDGVRIVFTDLEMAVSHFIPLTVVEPGSVTVPIKKFMEIMTNLRTDEVTISSDEAFRITIQSGKSRVKIGGTAKDAYPAIPEIDSSHSFSIPAVMASEMINATLFSASTESEDSRQFLNGLLWKYKDGKFSMVATDGRRLAVKTTAMVKSEQEFSVIVPPKILNEINKYIKSAGLKEDAVMQVSISSNQIGFMLGKTSFLSRLTEGTYPAYEQIIPQTHEVEVWADSGALLSVTKSASVCTSERGKVQYTFRSGAVTVNASSQNMDFEDEIPVSYEGEEFQISFNPVFIMDILKNIPAGQVICQFKTATTPALLKTQADETPLYIVMPLR